MYSQTVVRSCTVTKTITDKFGNPITVDFDPRDNGLICIHGSGVFSVEQVHELIGTLSATATAALPKPKKKKGGLRTVSTTRGDF